MIAGSDHIAAHSFKSSNWWDLRINRSVSITGIDFIFLSISSVGTKLETQILDFAFHIPTNEFAQLRRAASEEAEEGDDQSGLVDAAGTPDKADEAPGSPELRANKMGSLLSETPHHSLFLGLS